MADQDKKAALSELKEKMRDQSPGNRRLQELERALNLCNGRIDAIMTLRKHDRESLESFKDANEASKKDHELLVRRIVRINYLSTALCVLFVVVLLLK